MRPPTGVETENGGEWDGMENGTEGGTEEGTEDGGRTMVRPYSLQGTIRDWNRYGKDCSEDLWG